MGHCSAGDAYTKRFDDAIQGITRKYKCVDNTLLYDSSIEEAFWHTYESLSTCAAKGITLKPEKFQFARREVVWAGTNINPRMNASRPSRTSACQPDKPSISDIRSWYGSVYWNEQLQEKFCRAQDTICQLAKDGLAYYDKTRPTIAITDWSREGIGFIILQQYCHCSFAVAPFCCKAGWRLALCGSRHLTAAEAGYAAVEGEALAVAWCLQKARLFLLGCPNLTIVTDHRPLTKLLGDRALSEVVNPRLFRLKERTLQYRFQVKYLPGKRNAAADFLSRYPALRSPPSNVDADLDEDLTEAIAAAVIATAGYKGHILDESAVRKIAADDPVYQLLLAKVLASDWHQHKSQEVTCLRPFYGVRDRLAVIQDLVTYAFQQGCARLVILEPLRPQVAANLHAGHQGLESMLRRSTVADMFQHEGNTYMAYADRLTGWLELTHFPSGATSQRIKTQLRRYFTRWGAPEQLSTDGVLWLAEAAVKSAKKIIKANTGGGGTLDTDKASLALLQYLNTPLRTINKSPAQLAAGRQLRDGVLTARWHLRVDRHWGGTLRQREVQMGEAGNTLMANSTLRHLQPLAPDTRVRVQNQASDVWDRTGLVVEALPHRQYTIRLDGSGRIRLRNRKRLRLTSARALTEARNEVTLTTDPPSTPPPP
ncbi:uncharacterized protein LOC143030430 [Oratosquilla oratoria]|uniref:uncharacterized protein LOC143030430 n=1 Tax=Oratosquilla oratoria TaxID=337810 RepID=UPI003F772A5C